MLTDKKFGLKLPKFKREIKVGKDDLKEIEESIRSIWAEAREQLSKESVASLVANGMAQNNDL